jgi:Holliday junction resolvase-like predicted endonuclease
MINSWNHVIPGDILEIGRTFKNKFDVQPSAIQGIVLVLKIKTQNSSGRFDAAEAIGERTSQYEPHHNAKLFVMCKDKASWILLSRYDVIKVISTYAPQLT